MFPAGWTLAPQQISNKFLYELTVKSGIKQSDIRRFIQAKTESEPRWSSQQRAAGVKNKNELRDI